MSWDYAMELTGYLIHSPIQALSDVPSWVGLAGVEWISDEAQLLVESAVPGAWQDVAKMGIRGMMTNFRFEFVSLRGYL